MPANRQTPAGFPPSYLQMNHSAFSPSPQPLVVGNTTQGGVSKVSYRKVKRATKSGGFRHFIFLEAAFDQCPLDRELRKQRQRRRRPQGCEKLRISGALQ